MQPLNLRNLFMELDVSNFIPNLLNSLPGLLVCKDTSCYFSYANQFALKLFSVKKVSDIYGKSVSDLNCPIKELDSKFRSLELEVIRTGKTLRLIELVKYKYAYSLLFTTLSPLINSSKTITGVTINALDISHTDLQYNMKLLVENDSKLFHTKKV